MIKRSHPKLLISIVLASALVMLFFTNTLAGTTTRYGTVGGVNVRGEKSIYQYTYSWGAYIGSYADSAIGTIGYTYWTIQETCVPTGQITFYTQYPGAVNYLATQYYTGATINYRACSGQRQLKNTGNHDFKQGSGVWQPLVERIEYK